MISFALGLFPWYWWVVAVLGVALLTWSGLWPVAIALLRRIPRPVWIALAAGLVVFLLIRAGEKALEIHDDGVKAERDTYWKGREKASNDAWQAKLDKVQVQLDTSKGKLAAAAETQRVELARQKAYYDKRFDALKGTTYVSPAAVAACPLTRGVILQFNAGAAAANGEPDPPEVVAAAAAGPVAADERSGVPLDLYAAGVRETQSALGTCRRQVIGWQKYNAEIIEPWIDSTIAAFATLTGGSP